MNKYMITTMVSCFGLFVSAPAYASDEAKCDLYGNFGSALVDFMLPLKLQEFVDMMTGNAPELQEEMVSELIDGLSKKNLKTLMKLSQSDNETMGEAAGEVAVNLLMTGAATTPSEVNDLMEANCLAIGAQTIIDNQRRAQAANAQNFGE